MRRKFAATKFHGESVSTRIKLFHRDAPIVAIKATKNHPGICYAGYIHWQADSNYDARIKLCWKIGPRYAFGGIIFENMLQPLAIFYNIILAPISATIISKDSKIRTKLESGTLSTIYRIK